MWLLRRVLVETAGESAADMAHMVRLRPLFSQVQMLQRLRSGANARLFNSEHRGVWRSVAAVLQCAALEAPMRRKVWLLASAAVWALHGAAQAQSGRRVVAVLNGASPDDNMRRDLVDPLRQGLAELGMVDGRDDGKLLKGTPPGDSPFEQGTKFEFVLNLRAAQALGLSVPARVRVSAGAVIE
jgi:hypothetical protein